MKACGIALLVLSVGILLYAWKAAIPGNRTIRQVWQDNHWATARVDDESVSVRKSLSYSAAGVFILGLVLLVLPWRISDPQPVRPIENPASSAGNRH